jgi:hypothetical protein
MPDSLSRPEPERESASIDNLGCEIIQVEGPEDYTIRPIPEHIRK